MVSLQKKIAPSILAADFACLGAEVERVEAAGVEWLHIDVMDGHFVPNLSFGGPIIESIRKQSRLFFDVHLMASPAAPMIPLMAKAGADGITIHVEGSQNLRSDFQLIRSLGKKVGLAINPPTPAAAVQPYLDEVDLILVMTVNPGFGGQKLIPETLHKVTEVKAMLGSRPVDIEVDGGVTADNAGLAAAAGANIFVAGSAIFKGNAAEAIQSMRKAIA